MYSVGNLCRGTIENHISVLERLMYAVRGLLHHFGQLYVIYVALTYTVEGKSSPTAAVVASTIGMWLQHDMKRLLEEIPKLLKIMKPVRRVASLLACKARLETDPDSIMRQLCPPRFRGEIEFTNVHFAYPTERQKMVLNGLSFKASPGQKVALVGKAGCGKSTAIDLVQRFYAQANGEILIDGQPINAYDTDCLRKHIGVVAQTNVLFARSIYDNIVYGIDDPPGPESEAFLDVCRKSETWEFIRNFPNKQYTLVGENGVKLSGGQMQRVAIARVIIRQPTFLLLDEATSALDAINEKAVQASLDQMLKQFNGVALVVAHRLTTICNCDKIVVLGDDGTKVEEGTHSELMQVPKQIDDQGNPVAGPGLYHTLWDTQQVEGKSSQVTLAAAEAQVLELEKQVSQLRAELSWSRLAPHEAPKQLQRSLVTFESLSESSTWPIRHLHCRNLAAAPRLRRAQSNPTNNTD